MVLTGFGWLAGLCVRDLAKPCTDETACYGPSRSFEGIPCQLQLPDSVSFYRVPPHLVDSELEYRLTDTTVQLDLVSRFREELPVPAACLIFPTTATKRPPAPKTQ
ncbi:hypothetical protein N7462_006857 [Penicillium macrosclerotiorum]|uniref:uncharacterized protein n=1 Tax=Penicillium macrosclerotiorum TaxID=303699 RepID=UPI0025489D77|nr:uncharacterized protein N7462_006857 [Penicillium macrosclerotiorum]KAJ5678613.1 hypothetical protein N7462_006857 [Penicillium macrosclerotiorum]